MEISTTFTILLPADEAYRFLLDLQQVAPCVPGGELGPAAADGTYPANVTVRLGPMRLGYSGSLWISEQDDSSRRAVLRAKATDERTRLHAECRTGDRLGADARRAWLADHLSLRPGVSRLLPSHRAEGRAGPADGCGRRADAGRSGAGPRGGRACARTSGDAGA